MSDELTYAAFVTLVGCWFRLHVDEERAIDVQLSQVDPLPSQSRPPIREPFVLLFHGSSDPVLSQRTYKMEVAALGPIEVFLVPIGPDEVGMRYQAVFN